MWSRAHRTTWLKSHQEVSQHLELVASNLVWKYNYNFFTSWCAAYFVASFILRRRERKSREGSASRDVNQQPVGERRGFSCLWPTEIEVTARVTDHRANLRRENRNIKITCLGKEGWGNLNIKLPFVSTIAHLPSIHTLPNANKHCITWTKYRPRGYTDYDHCYTKEDTDVQVIQTLHKHIVVHARQIQIFTHVTTLYYILTHKCIGNHTYVHILKSSRIV